jgi:pseudouridine-5'-phosphate glycosidase
VANPIPAEFSADPKLIQEAIELGLKAAAAQGVTGKDLTPFLLRFVNEQTKGKSLESNRALVEDNVQVGTAIAVAYAGV